VKSVYVITKGCIYEGGGVYGVFVREDLANVKFEEMLEFERKMNQQQEEYNIQLQLEHGCALSEPGYWLTEEETIEDDRRDIVFHRQEYLTLRRHDCEE